MTTWRDYADKLTAEQIERLEHSEASRLDAFPLSPCRINAAAELIHQAGRYSEENALQVTLAGVRAPEDAVTVHPWEVDEEVRTFVGSSWRVPATRDLLANEIVIEIHGLQRSDGTVTRWLHINGTITDLPLSASRMLLESLAEANAEAVRMNAVDGGTMSSFPTFSAVDR